jgi:drug/metabolite transporter (DMT)-like permease
LSRISVGDAALIVLIGLFWGLNWPAVKILIGEIAPFTLRATGFAAGAVVLSVLAYGRAEALMPQRAEWVQLVAAGLLTVFGFNVLTAFGQLVTETSKAAIIAFTMPVWTAVFAALFLGENLGAARVLAIALGMSALALLIDEDLPAFLAAPKGALFMLGSALSWAAGTVVLKDRTWSIGPLARTAWMLAVSTPPAVVAALVFEQPWQQGRPSPLVLATLVFHIALPMAFCYAAWVTLVARLPASVAAIGTLLIPVVGVVSASAIFGDALTWQRLSALALVLISITAALRAPPRSTEPRPTSPR